jgi:hypothetical protein
MGSLPALLTSDQYPNIPVRPDFARAARIHVSQIPSVFTEDVVPPVPLLAWSPRYQTDPPAHQHRHNRTPQYWPFFFWAQNVGDILVTQVAAESLEQTDIQQARITQVAVEALEDPTTPGLARVTSLVIELIHPFECVTIPQQPGIPPEACPVPDGLTVRVV